MWLLTVFIIGALGLIPGLHFSDTSTLRTYDHLDLCLEKIISCDYYRQSFSLYEKDIGMFSNIEDLKKACKQQVPYMRCIARAEKFCEETIHSHLLQEMIKNRRFPTGICRPPSPWQQVYLREASCLNAYSRKAFVHCINKKVGFRNRNKVNSVEFGCRYVNTIIDCSASIVQEKCGYYAEYILKNFLKFHSLSDYKCVGFKVDDIEDNSLSFTPNYDIIEAIFKISKGPITYNEPTETTVTMKDTDFVEVQLDHLGDHVLDHPLTEESTTNFEFHYLAPEEVLEKTKDSLPDSFGFQIKTEDGKQDSMDFPTLPKRHYMLKNRTTFALYEDFEMGHTKYIGCGEADFFWVILSPLRNKYCTLMDLKSEYSESIFKCTIHIDAPCSVELYDEVRREIAEVFHRRYVLTVLTPPNNQRAEDMAVMNVHYLKIYPSSSMHVPEEKTNLWTDQANKLPIVETEQVDRKGPFEREDDNILYRHSNGSGQKRDANVRKHPHNLDEVEYYEEYENSDYYPLDQDDDVFFPELLTNDVIYIEDINGELISLHDQRSPIYLKSLYQPHFLFRPRIGVISAATDPLDEDGTNQKKLVQSSIFEERTSTFKDKISISKTNPNQKGHCTAEAPCPPNSETISKFGAKPGMHIDLQNIKTFDPFKGLNKEIPRQIQNPNSFKLEDGIDEEPFIRSRSAYVITPSSKIELRESTDTRTSEKLCTINELVTDRSRYSIEELCGKRKDIADDFSLEPDCSTTVTSAPESDSKIDYLESFGEHYTYEITQGPYDYLNNYPNTKVNLKSTFDPMELEAVSSSKNKSEWKADILKIFGKFLKVLYKGAKILLYDKYYIEP